MQIHSTNIHGLGASQVVQSFLESADNMGLLENSVIYLPEKGRLSEFRGSTGSYFRYKRIFPNGFSRIIECLLSPIFFNNVETIVLGDLPLRGIDNQVVLVHQPNLIYPIVNKYSSKKLNFRISRFIFSLNIRYTKKVIVQTGIMADDLIKSYPRLKNKILVMPQPVPSWFLEVSPEKSVLNGKLKLFYPAAFYPHKRHDFLKKLNDYCDSKKINSSEFEIWVTLSQEEFQPYKNISFLKNLGRLDSKGMKRYYESSDALLFLSSVESYGLPLVEALTINSSIIAPDLKYARWMCEDAAYYFKPYCAESLLSTILSLKDDLIKGKKLDAEQALKKFPDSWDKVVETFYNSLR